MADKLLSIEEVSRYLGVSEEEVKRLVEQGKLEAYRLVGDILRFNKEEVVRLKPLPESGLVSDEVASSVSDKENTSPKYFPNFLGDRIKDFLYFNDFYIISAVIVAALIFLIVYLE